MTRVLRLIVALLVREIGQSVATDSASCWMDSLARNIVDDWGFRQVRFISRSLRSDGPAGRIFAEMQARLMEKSPALWINIEENFGNGSNPVSQSFMKRFVTTDVTASFIILVHESRDNLVSVLRTYELIDFAAEVTIYQYRPYYLLLWIDESPEASLEDIMAYAWTKKMYDLTIVELSETKRSPGNRPMLVETSLTSTIVHRYDRFKGEYARMNLTSDVPLWFPDKVANMAGHSLNVVAVDAPPFSIVRFDESREAKDVNGATFHLITIIARKLNATLNYLPVQSMDYKKMSRARTLHTIIISNKVDLQAYLSPHYSGYIGDRVLRTTTVINDQWCPVVPVLPIKRIPISMSFFIPYLLSIAIVISFGLLRRVFRFNETSKWQPFDIARVLFAIPIRLRPHGITERVIFGCLIVVSIMYSNSMYTSMTKVSLQLDGEMEFRSFNDLDESGLIPIITSLMMNKTFNHPDRTMLSLRDKSQRATSKIFMCPILAAKHKNITCLMSKQEAMVAMESMRKFYGRDDIKIAETCFWHDTRAFLVGPGSPYLHAIDRVIMRMQHAGVVKKLYDYEYSDTYDFVNNVTSREPILKKRARNTIVLRQRLLAIVSIGCTLSFLVLFAELVHDRLSKRSAVHFVQRASAHQSSSHRDKRRRNFRNAKNRANN